MPRPCYWSKLDSQSDLKNPQINGDLSSYYSADGDGVNHVEWGWNYNTSIKFGKCLSNIAWGNASWSRFNIFPGFTIQNNKQMTVSSWISFYAGGASYLYYSIYFSNNCTVRCWLHENGVFRFEIIVGGSVIESKIVPYTGTGHLYVVVDGNKGFSDGKSIRVFWNGFEAVYTKATIPDISLPYPVVQSYIEIYSVNNSQLFTDNLKIWNEVVTEDPSWEYNAGLGREDAMHIIYGEANYYKPGNIKVGYYYY